MIVSGAFAGKQYAVLGLARSGMATVAALVASGAEVVAWDSEVERRDEVLTLAGAGGSVQPKPPTQPSPRGGEGFSVSLGDPLEIELDGFDAVVVSPGVPLNRHPIAGRAAAAGVPVIGDIELFAQARASLPAHRVVGITGTNGKSTTTALVFHLLETAGVPALMGGNIGLPIMGRDALPAGGVYVLELSSYQIDLTRTLDCDVAVLLNITPDHLDRYDGFAAYAASKARLFAMQTGGVAVIAVEDDETRVVAAGLATADAAELVEVRSSDVGDQSAWPALQGPHNAQNVAVAVAVVRALGVDKDAIARGLESYPGLPHRMERIATVDGVLYVNDSKATNPTSTAPALAAYSKVHWILGGMAKTRDLDAVADELGHVVAAYTIGDSAALYAGLLTERGIPVVNAGTLERALGAAREAARAGEVVLLSPACASFDQYRDYEARGDAFRDLVGAMQS
ncbi:UDP-N-acetylmuramoyl-L-alanine--D-glutamate ligase [Sphingomonas prati]|uniref:UDP-N-acetylmuramoyl-L-alanine--D-glutamate ligase n=1 Tax=Sphingomonas prati TaxID=1843237 RepID=UPI0012F66B9B|nr:UDP-N-acetylmuramoyl-L-alanine--D-glutamate ligase [Sphingomonas prati]GGE88494.1 UDP-N-acetylmuramoylalanine--D-glutamate ligase [Sphingomonas prati]